MLRVPHAVRLACRYFVAIAKPMSLRPAICAATAFLFRLTPHRDGVTYDFEARSLRTDCSNGLDRAAKRALRASRRSTGREGGCRSGSRVGASRQQFHL